jgi:hypothetical protein
VRRELAVALVACAAAWALASGCKGSVETTSTSSGTGTGSGAGGAGPAICPGASPAPDGYATCHTSSDCPNDWDSCDIDPDPGCGIEEVATMTCAHDADCGAAFVCQDYYLTGSCVDPAQSHGTECQSPCSAYTCDSTWAVCGSDGHCQPTPCGGGWACAAGEVCQAGSAGADMHGCAPQSCTDGYDCGAGVATCTPGGAGADAHGCVPISCASGYACGANQRCDAPYGDAHHCTKLQCQVDADCDCGACVEQLCQVRIGVCVEPAE